MYKTKVTIAPGFESPFDYQVKLTELGNESSTLTATELDGGSALHERLWSTQESANVWVAWALAQTNVVSAVVEEVV